MTVHRIETDNPGSLARQLLAEGKAERGDTLKTLYKGNPSMTGLVGWFADHCVLETAKDGPRYAKWRPFPVDAFRSRTPVSGDGL
jgi:hypothetical protein